MYLLNTGHSVLADTGTRFPSLDALSLVYSPNNGYSVPQVHVQGSQSSCTITGVLTKHWIQCPLRYSYRVPSLTALSLVYSPNTGYSVLPGTGTAGQLPSLQALLVSLVHSLSDISHWVSYTTALNKRCVYITTTFLLRQK